MEMLLMEESRAPVVDGGEAENGGCSACRLSQGLPRLGGPGLMLAPGWLRACELRVEFLTVRWKVLEGWLDVCRGNNRLYIWVYLLAKIYLEL
ncbi:hypothetical protein LXL04_006829 [Taraxacum kok-saghyz]